MEREDRYLVIKLSDIHQALSLSQQDALNELLIEINDDRSLRGKRADKKYVVVADDWPEYETVWKMIADRVDKGDAL